MNRYPLWKYILIGIVLIIGLVYTLPNFYGESPAVQVNLRQSNGEGHRADALAGRDCAREREP